MSAEEELQLALDNHTREVKEQFRLYRLERFLGAYPLTGAGFTFAQAEELERRGADYHLAEQLAAGPSACPPELAMEILV